LRFVFSRKKIIQSSTRKKLASVVRFRFRSNDAREAHVFSLAFYTHSTGRAFTSLERHTRFVFS